jgi:hypothetical protein
MPFPFAPSPGADRELEAARRYPDREALELAAAGAAWTLGPDHSATKALTRASETMDRVDLWRARLALKRLHRDQRAAIAEAVEGA